MHRIEFAKADMQAWETRDSYPHRRADASRNFEFLITLPSAMHGSFIWGCISILACFWRVAEANTEIINIEALEASLSLSNLPPTWYVQYNLNNTHLLTSVSLSRKVLSADSAESVFAIVPAPLHTPLTSVCNFQKSGCPYEAWVMLDLDHPHWVPFSKFTSRVSWPANVSFVFLSFKRSYDSWKFVTVSCGLPHRSNATVKCGAILGSAGRASRKPYHCFGEHKDSISVCAYPCG